MDSSFIVGLYSIGVIANVPYCEIMPCLSWFIVISNLMLAGQTQKCMDLLLHVILLMIFTSYNRSASYEGHNFALHSLEVFLGLWLCTMMTSFVLWSGYFQWKSPKYAEEIRTTFIFYRQCVLLARIYKRHFSSNELLVALWNPFCIGSLSFALSLPLYVALSPFSQNSTEV